MKRSAAPIAGLVCVLVAGLSHVSASAVVVWIAGVAILGYCAGRSFMRRPDEQHENHRNNHS